MKFLILLMLSLSLHAERVDLFTHFANDPYVSFAQLEKAGIEVCLADLNNYAREASFVEPKKAIFFHPFSIPIHFARIPKEKMILFLWEPVDIPLWYFDRFSRVYTWNDALVDGVKFFKFYYPYRQPMIANLVPFEQKKLCVMINSNLTFERCKMLDFFEEKPIGDLDFFGVRKAKAANYKSYRGPLLGEHSGNEKIGTLKNYRFCICFENCHHMPGYVTEKIFGCFAAGCIPIYWGAPNIENYISKDCFIDYRDFSNKEELYQFIKTMPELVYDGYIARIQDYLNSASSYLFSKEDLEGLLYNAVNN